MHLIPDLDTGGAQSLLVSLVRSFEPEGVQSHVVNLREGGTFAGEIANLGVPLIQLGCSSPVSLTARMPNLVAIIRRINPDVLHAWLYNSSLISLVVGPLLEKVRVVWGIHRSELDPQVTNARTRGVVTVVAQASRRSQSLARIVYCTREARSVHEEIGFDQEKGSVIENGIDLDRFRPDEAAKIRVRRELGADVDTPLVGLVARFHPIKDHATFLAAAQRVRAEIPDTEFILCGANITPENPELRSMIRRNDLGDSCHLLGRRSGIEEITAALDVAVSSSRNESFSRTLAEAMASGVPPVATATSGPKHLVGSCGRLVPVGCPRALAEAIVELLRLTPDRRRRLGTEARDRIRRRWSIESSAADYSALYHELASS